MTTMKKILKNAICLSIISFVCLGVAGFGSVENPKQKVSDLLQSENYEEMISYYNGLEEKKSTMASVNEEIINYIDDLYSAKRNEKNYKRILEACEDLSKINNKEIVFQVSLLQGFIECEYSGDAALDQAYKYYNQKDYSKVMEYASNVDSKYSKYELLEKLYIDSKYEIFQQSKEANTVKEYEICIDILHKVSESTQDLDIIELEEYMKSELESTKKVGKALTSASNYYNQGAYQACFKELEESKKKFANNKKIEYYDSVYHSSYILKISEEFVSLMDKQQYEEAEKLVRSAIEVYDCDSFRQLLDLVREKTDFWYSFGKSCRCSFLYGTKCA